MVVVVCFFFLFRPTDSFIPPFLHNSGTAYSYVWDSTKFLNGSDAGGGSYASPILHHTLVSGLVPGVTYFYKIDNAPQLPNGTVQGTPFYGQFKMPGGYPLRIGTGADSGEVSNVTTNIDYTIESKPDLFVLIGDLTYANKYALDPAYCIEGAPECNYLNSKSVSTYPPRWDAYSRLFEPLMSKVPTMVAIGNHELEMTPVTSNSQIPSMLNNWNNNLFFTRFTQFLARYPLPQTAAIARNGPTAADLGPITPTTNQGKGMYYVTEVPGVATIVVLSVYTYSDQYLPTDEQYQWALDVFSKVDRAKTPWLIVAMHAGFYTTSQMFLQMECMRILYEPLFRAFSVDVIFSGHSHDAERAGPMFNWQLDKECGMNYITVGSFGPDEGITTAWVDQWNVPAAAATFPSCPNQPTIYNPNAASIPYVVTAPGQWGPGGRCIPPSWPPRATGARRRSPTGAGSASTRTARARSTS
jgi:acid phosphatase type 7